MYPLFKVRGPEMPADNVELLKLKESQEPIASFLKIKLIELTPGNAKVTMTIKPEHLNFNGLVFGGIIMSLADQAFAYGMNSIVTPNIATHFNIQLISGAKVGDILTAECRSLKNGRRVGFAEMIVTNQDGKLIAKASGTTAVTA
jgi:acyl-CoA thioesterase